MAEEERIQEKHKKSVGFLLWKFEILCWLGSVCFFVGVVVALLQFKGRPLPELRLHITPSAIIVRLATFCQALMMASVSASIGQLKWARVRRTRPLFEMIVLDVLLHSLYSFSIYKSAYGCFGFQRVAGFMFGIDLFDD